MINSVVIAGRVVSPIKRYPGKIVFTLANDTGRYYVEWPHPPSTHIQQHDEVVINGQLISIQHKRRHHSRIKAATVQKLN